MFSRYVLPMVLILAVCFSAHAQPAAPTQAKHSKTSVTNFGGNLSSADTTVQKALDTLDEVAGVGDTTETNQDDAWKAVGDGTGTETFIAVTYQDATNDVDFVVPVLDEDDMASNSAVHLSTQQALKAYVDAAIAASGSQLTEEEVEDFVGGMLGGTETLIAVTYQDATGDIDFEITDAEITALAGLTSAANSIPIFTGSGTADLIVAPANSQSLLAAANYAAMKALLDLEIGTDVQAQHAQLQDIADDTYAQGDIIYYDGANLTNLGPGVAGQYLQTGGAAANPSWQSTGVSGDIEDVGDATSGAAFTADGTGTTLYFEGTTANAFEAILTSVDVSADVTITMPEITGTLVLGPAAFGTDNRVIKTNGTGNLMQITGISIDDSNNTSGVGTIGSGAITSSGVVAGTGFTIGSAAILEAELEIIDGATLTTTQLEYLNAATGTTGTTNTNLVFSASPTFTGTVVAAAIDGSGTFSANLFTPDAADGADIGSTTLEFSDLYLADGSIIYFGADQDVTLTHTADTGLTLNLALTVAGAATFSDTIAANGEITMGADFNLNANEIQTTGNAIIQLSTADNTSYFEIQDSASAMAHRFYADGTWSPAPSLDPYWMFDDDTLTTQFVIYAKDTTTDVLQFGWTSNESAVIANFTMGAELAITSGNFNVIGVYQVDGTQIALTDLSDGLSHAAGHIMSGADEIDGDLIDIDYAETNYTPATTGVATNINQLAAHLEGIDDALGASAAGTLTGLTDTADVDYTSGAIIVGDGTNSFDEKALSGDGTLDSAGALTVIGVALSTASTISESGIELTDDAYLELNATADGMADDEYNGVLIGGRNCGEGLTLHDTVRLANDADPWHQADANAAGEFPAHGIAIAACTDTNEAKILVRGVIRNEGWTGLTPAGKVYLSTTAGGLTQTAPSTSGDAVQIVGWALSDSEIYFDFSRPYLEVP